MNKTLEAFAKKTLKELLSQLPEANHKVFKRMYSPKDLELPINEVVDKMYVDTLDHAMVQVENTLDNELRIGKEESLNLRFGGGIGSECCPCFICGGDDSLRSNISGFVKSKISGETIVKMFSDKVFLDYRPSEPSWIQIKIGACEKHRGNLEKLAKAIIDKKYVISRTIIDKAKTMSVHLMPAKEGHCQVCYIKHRPDEPHNAQSLPYQVWFLNTYGREATWADALAHCAENIKAKWKEKLEQREAWTEPEDGKPIVTVDEYEGKAIPKPMPNMEPEVITIKNGGK